MKSAALALLLVQPAAAAELYLQTGLALQARHGACSPPPVCLWDRNTYAPLLGHVEMGIEQRRGRLTGSLFVRHESLPQHHDFGVNQAGVALRVTLWSIP